MYDTVVLNLKLGSSSIGESSSAGLTSTDEPSASFQPMAQLEDTDYTEEDEWSDEEEEEDKKGRMLITGATSLSHTGEVGASVGGTSAAGVSMGTFGSRSKLARPKAPLAKQ